MKHFEVLLSYVGTSIVNKVSRATNFQSVTQKY